ncbi:MAG: response regulator [Nitrospira sp.]|nr:response regulator [Nitrospira sp.]
MNNPAPGQPNDQNEPASLARLSNEPDRPTLLLVEDEQDTADLVTMIMEAEGYHVIHAANGRFALGLIESLPPPALVLLDMLLPYISGAALLEHIRQTELSWKDVPVIMLTADNSARDVRECLALGARDYILKPFKRDMLVSRLRRFRPDRADSTMA